jgi:hypothetical protein
MVLRPYDLHELGLGRAVFVRDLDGDARFSPTVEGGAQEYRVVDITRSKPDGARLVTLQNRLFVETPLLLGVLTATRGRLTHAEVERQLAIATHDVALDDIHDREKISRCRLKRIGAAVERLALIDTLNSPTVSAALYMQQPSLVTYLLLTCFDLLGQHHDWVDFDTWLKSSRSQRERSEALAGADSELSVDEQVRRLWDRYNEVYGVRTSFLFFLEHWVPTEARRDLLDHVNIEQWPTPPNAGAREDVDDDSKKQAWLIRLRHNYTHRAQFVAGLHPDQIPPDYRDGWWLMEAQMTRTKTTRYSVCDWPAVLERAVRRGLEAFVRGIEPVSPDSVLRVPR